jgi:hypothetical protein
VRGQQREVGGQLGGYLDGCEVLAVAGRFGDDASVAGISPGFGT